MPNETTIQAGCTAARTTVNPPERRIADVEQKTCTDHAAEYCPDLADGNDADDLAFCLTTDDAKAKFAALKGGGRPADPPPPPRPVASIAAQVVNDLASIDSVRLTGTDISTVTGDDRIKLRNLLGQLGTAGTEGVDPKVQARIATFLGNSTNTGDLEPAFAAARTHWGVGGPVAPRVPDPAPAPEPDPADGEKGLSRDWTREPNILRAYVQGITPFAGANFFDQFASAGVSGSENLLSPGDQNSLFDGFRTGFGLDYFRRVFESETLDLFAGVGIDVLWATRNGLMVKDAANLAEFEEQSGNASWKETSLDGQAKLALHVGKYFWAIVSFGAGYFLREGHGGNFFSGNAVLEEPRTDKDFDAGSLLIVGGVEVCVGGLIAGPWGVEACAGVGFSAPINTDKDSGFDHLTSKDNEGYGSAKIGTYFQF